MNMISLRNFELVAWVFHLATRLNKENEPTQELVSKVAASNSADTLRCLIFISINFKTSVKIVKKNFAKATIRSI